MSNESKRKPGKLNIIDLIIIAVVVLALVFIGWKLLGSDSPISSSQTLYLTVYEAEVANYVADEIEVGDVASDGSGNDIVRIGTVHSVVKRDSDTYELNESTNEYIKTSKPDHCSVYVTLEVQGTMTDNGILIGSQLYGVGHSMVLYAGDAKMYLVVYDCSDSPDSY